MVRLREVTPRNVWAYVTGNLRFFAFRTRGLRWAVGRAFRLQIVFRLLMMREECYDRGQCVRCGCRTVNLQFAAKACEGNCYPPLMPLWRFLRLMRGDAVYAGGAVWKFEAELLPGGARRLVLRRDGAVVNDRVVPPARVAMVYKFLNGISDGMYGECDCDAAGAEAGRAGGGGVPGDGGLHGAQG